MIAAPSLTSVILNMVQQIHNGIEESHIYFTKRQATKGCGNASKLQTNSEPNNTSPRGNHELGT